MCVALNYFLLPPLLARDFLVSSSAPWLATDGDFGGNVSSACKGEDMLLQPPHQATAKMRRDDDLSFISLLIMVQRNRDLRTILGYSMLVAFALDSFYICLSMAGSIRLPYYNLPIFFFRLLIPSKPSGVRTSDGCTWIGDNDVVHWPSVLSNQRCGDPVRC